MINSISTKNSIETDISPMPEIKKPIIFSGGLGAQDKKLHVDESIPSSSEFSSTELGFLTLFNKTKEDSNKATSEADKNREENIKKGIPPTVLGPSGKPKIIKPKHPSKKAAEDSATSDGKRGEAPDHHPNPVEGDPHFHPSGNNNRTHHSYPRSGAKYHPPKKRD